MPEWLRDMIARRGAHDAGGLPLGAGCHEGLSFHSLNQGWNAAPNSPEPVISVDGEALVPGARPNSYHHAMADNVERYRIVFDGATRWRATPVNDEGWYKGQCRFSGCAPACGEFYEIEGDTRDDPDLTPWQEVAPVRTSDGVRYFHFYLRDETLEVKARDWRLETVTKEASHV